VGDGSDLGAGSDRTAGPDSDAGSNLTAGPDLGSALESIYEALNRRAFTDTDPVAFLYAHDDPGDREIVALVASSLAYGRVAQIRKSVSAVLDRLGSSPARFAVDARPDAIRRALEGFRHRFAGGDDVAAMLIGAAAVVRRHGSLGARFAELLRPDDATVLPALGRFAGELVKEGGGRTSHLLPRPDRGSACKRFHLFLRWMVRSDDVDPGGWDGVSPSLLIVPVDTHMHRIATRLGLTERRQADERTALEITSGFAAFRPDDPVRYDFALTRLGIRRGEEVERIIAGAPALAAALDAA